MDVDPAVVVAMAEAARWAPSVHNTQPWRFRSRPDGLDVLVDTDRSLPALDPDGRLRTVSCGAAAASAACMSTALGLATRTALLPDGPRGEVVARLVCVDRRTPTAADRRLAAAVPRRRTHPVLHPAEPLGDDRLDDLAVTVEDEGVTMTVLDPTGRRQLVELLLRALEEHRRRPVLVEETRRWLRVPAPRARVEDGVLRASMSAWPYPAGSAVREDPSAMVDSALAQDVPHATVLLLSTPSDSRRDQLVAGIALQRLLLHATALDVAASFCDLATQLPSTREQLRGLLPRGGHVQVALRLGRQLVDVRTPPRRPLAELLDVVDEPRPAAGVQHAAPASSPVGDRR